MKGLSSLERIILEAIGWSSLSYEEIKDQTGLQENVCFNIIQALMIRGVLKSLDGKYRVNDTLSPLIMDELNGIEARKAESLELMEAILESKGERVYRIQKVALDSRDEKIFVAMLSNLEMFLKEANKKAEKSVAIKDRKVIFWGMSNVHTLMSQVIRGD